jgi:chemotaxis protein MotB
MSGGGGGDGPGAPLWIVSFADMISNLVIFFIVLATFATKTTESNKVPKKVLEGDLGIYGSSRERPNPAVVARPGPKSWNATAPETPSRRKGTDADALQSKIQGKEYHVRPNISKLKDGLRITLEDSAFAAGSDELSADGRELIAEIGRFFRDESVEIVVEAHTDDRTFRFSRHGSDVDLTRAMAMAVAEVLVSESGIAPPRVGISPFGSGRPLEPNVTAAARARNRRVEIVAKELP